MPTYGYRCQSCSDEFEVWQKMTDEPVASCPRCGGSGRRLIFPAGIVFKGSGFYATDNRRGSGGGDTSKDGTAAASAKTDKKTEKKTDTKSDSTSSPTPSGGGSTSSSS